MLWCTRIIKIVYSLDLKDCTGCVSINIPAFYENTDVRNAGM